MYYINYDMGIIYFTFLFFREFGMGKNTFILLYYMYICYDMGKVYFTILA